MNRSNVLQVIEYVKGSPETMDYGRWGALNPEQRHFIAHLCESWLILDGATTLQTKEIERLNNIINELEKDIKNLYTYGIKNNAEQRDYLLNRLEGLKELKGSNNNE